MNNVIFLKIVKKVLISKNLRNYEHEIYRIIKTLTAGTKRLAEQQIQGLHSINRVYYLNLINFNEKAHITFVYDLALFFC